MKKSKIIIIIVLLVLLVIITFNLFTKSIKANIIFGTNKCEAGEHILTTDITKKKCLLCFSEFNGSSLQASICSECAHELGRCSQSGKIKNKEYHYNEKY